MTGRTVREDRPAQQDLVELLTPLIEGEVRADPYTRHIYRSDASMYAIEPLAVAFPRHAADVSAIVDAAARFDLPVLPRGAGTSLAGQTVGRAIVMDFSRHMNRILDIDTVSRAARVEPGVVQEHLNRALSADGLMFGPDTSTSNRATIGGMIGNNSAGSRSIRYGSTIDSVVALDVVLSDATRAVLAAGSLGGLAGGGLASRLHHGMTGILDRYAEALSGMPQHWRHSGGYRLDRVRVKDGLDLSKLVVGSEGTLAVVTEATVSVVARPASVGLALGLFRSLESAVAATEDALAEEPASVELMDELILRLARQRTPHARLPRIIDDATAALLVVEFFGADDADVAAQIDRLSARWARDSRATATLRAITPRERTDVLEVRRSSLALLMAASEGSLRPLAFVEDTAVPPQMLVPYVREFTAILERYGLRAGFYGHCSVGCLHVRPYIDLRRPGQADAMRAVAREVLDLVREFGGVNSSEHGDGLARSEFNPEFFGADVYAAMREVKYLFDPHRRLNPGKIVDAPPMTENLRDASLAPAPPLLTIRRFADRDGMRGVADRCMNIGACRKQTAGVMCPSFRATGEEEHSTRGRANALVKALSTDDPAAALADERLHGILDLCLGCHACRSECPLGVDIASLKSEALYHYHQAHGTPLRSRMFGSIRRVNAWGSRLAPLSTLATRVPGVRRLIDRGLGITRHRPLPAFHRDNLRVWHARRAGASSVPASRELVLLADSFTTYTEPAIGRAAVELFEAAGWRVHLVGGVCCGRANLSTGRLPQARRMAAATLDALMPFAARDVPIVGLEPSCLLAIRDDYPSLLPDDRRLAAVSRHLTFGADLIIEAIDTGRLALDTCSSVSDRRILLHPHCHERASFGAATARDLINLVPGAEVVELDAGCCGMAGSFGYESEHYDLSMRIGELRLLPAIRAEPQRSLIVTSGVSCRQQIAHGSGRTAMHPLELIHAALKPATRGSLPRMGGDLDDRTVH